MNLRSAAATKLIGGLTLLVALALGWLLLVGPMLSDIDEVEESRSTAEDANTLLLGQLGQLRSQAEDLSRTTESAAELSRIFPPTADQPGFFAGVNAAAAAAGIAPDAISTLSPGVPTLVGEPAAGTDPTAPAGTETEPGGGTAAGSAAQAAPTTDPSALAVQTVSLGVSATYGELQEFLEQLETMPRALLPGGVSIARGEGEELLMTLTGAAFVAPPLQAPPAEPDRG